MKLKEIVNNILEAHSGGIKFIELLMELLVSHYNNHEISEFNAEDDNNIPEVILKEISRIQGVGILEYLSKPLNRTKYFIYTK